MYEKQTISRRQKVDSGSAVGFGKEEGEEWTVKKEIFRSDRLSRSWFMVMVHE